MARQSTFSVAKAHEENQGVVLVAMAEKKQITSECRRRGDLSVCLLPLI